VRIGAKAPLSLFIIFSKNTFTAMFSSNIPLVSIVMVTYNHEKYIEKAIESVLLQKTNFHFRLIIGEDCSTDDTLKICQRYQKNHSERIELITYEKNVGSSTNAINVFSKAVGCGSKYLAILDGDDYWIDEYKLQKQVDALEKNIDCSMCFTNLIRFVEKTEEYTPNVISRVPDSKIFIDEYIDKGVYMPSLTVMLKVSCYPFNIPDWVLKIIKLDWFIFLCLLRRGPAYFLNENTGVYRVNSGGIMHTKKVKLLSNSLFMVENTREYLYPEYQDVFANIISWHAADLAFAYLQEKDLKNFYKYMLKAVKSGDRKSLKWYWLKFRHALSIVKVFF